MNTTPRQVVDYWTCHEDESGLSVDWAEAERRCWRCAHERPLQRCHIVPRALGGSDEPCNLVLLCGQCHAEAPNVDDPKFMWVWLRAHAARIYGTYWHIRGEREYEFIYGSKPLNGINEDEIGLPRLRVVIQQRMRQTSTHWGHGRLNPATIAWLLRQIELDLST